MTEDKICPLWLPAHGDFLLEPQLFPVRISTNKLKLTDSLEMKLNIKHEGPNSSTALEPTQANRRIRAKIKKMNPV